MTDVQRFLKQAKDEIAALGKKHGFNFTEEAASEMVALGRKHGFAFTKEEVRQIARGDELSDNELEGVAGGVDTQDAARRFFTGW